MELLVGTKKGLFVLEGEAGGPMDVVHRQFEGDVVEFAMRDRRSGRYFASVTSGHFGPHIYRAHQPTGPWEETRLAFPEDTGAALVRVWVIKSGEGDGVLHAGTDPAALFTSTDNGDTWELNRALWDHPTRPSWNPGGGGLAMHSISTWPGDPSRIAVGISAAGVWLSDDGGESWRPSDHDAIKPRYVPEESLAENTAFCIHNMHRSPVKPERLFMQFHGGVYRSDDGGETWIDIANDLISDFGFPLALDPHDPDTAYVIPLVADMDRVTPEGQVRVFKTEDAGATWASTSKGLPDKDAYLTVLRQAFCQDGGKPLGLYFGATSGEVFASGDGGESWATAALRLPPVLSVRCSA